VATQLIRKNWRSAFASGSPAISIPRRYLILAAVITVGVVYLSMAASLYTSGRDERTAETQYLDATHLLSVPPVPIATLQAELAAARNSLAWVEASASQSTIDPSSDDATELLVQRAQDAGLSVTGIARLNQAQAKFEDKAYTVDGIRTSVDGPSHVTIIEFLRALEATDPRLVPSLSSLAIQEGRAHAEIVFSLYTEIVATPTAVPAEIQP
jgi:hypothetical protein